MQDRKHNQPTTGQQMPKTPHQRITGSVAFHEQTLRLVQCLYDTMDLAVRMGRSEHDEYNTIGLHLGSAGACLKNSLLAPDTVMRREFNRMANQAIGHALRKCGLGEGPYLAEIKHLAARVALA